MKNKFNIKKFSLIELIITIIVICILAAMALPKFIGVERDSKVSAMDRDLDVLEKAVDLYVSNNDGNYPFVTDESGNYSKVIVTRETLKDTLDAIGDDESNIYTLDINKLEPYIQKLKYNNPTTDLYLYSTKTNVAINEQGKIDSSGIMHHILNGTGNTSTNNVITQLITLMPNAPFSDDSFVITKNHALYGWGYNGFYQLGDNTFLNKGTPINITSIDGIKFTKISSSAYRSMAIGEDGELYAWGTNSNGELGDGTTTNRMIPTKITLPNGVKPTQISSGSCSMVIGDDGNLYAWGYNSMGEVGDGTTANVTTPKKITLAIGVKAKQIFSGSSSMVIGSDGNLYTWGQDEWGQLGIGTANWNPHCTPTKVVFPNGVNPITITAGQSHVMAICSDGELYAWGCNLWGQLGTNTVDRSFTPIKISLSGGVKPKLIAAGQYHSMAIGDDGNLYTWGINNYGQLGINTGIADSSAHYVPNKITLGSGAIPTQISCGANHSLAIDSNNNLYTWGDSNYSPTKITYNFE